MITATYRSLIQGHLTGLVVAGKGYDIQLGTGRSLLEDLHPHPQHARLDACRASESVLEEHPSQSDISVWHER